MLKTILRLSLMASALIVLAAQAHAQQTVQGRTVGYDKDQNTITFIKDLKNDPANPEYTALPPMIFTLPAGALQPSAEPKAGGRMKLDAKKSQIIIYEPKAMVFKTIDYKPVEQQDNVAPDDAQVAGKKFPAVDKDRGTVTVYSKRQMILTTFAPPAECLAWPASTWDSGDEVRVTYTEPGKAASIENLSKR